MLKPWDAVSHPASCSVFLASPKIGPSRPHFFAAHIEKSEAKTFFKKFVEVEVKPQGF